MEVGVNVKRKLTLLLVFLAASIPGFGNIGFCPFFGNCSTPTGADGQTIAIPKEAPYLDDVTLFSFELYSNGGSGSRTPGTWYLLLAVPNNIGGAPGLMPGRFGFNAFADAGTFLPTTTGSIYDFASGITGLSGGDGSMSAANMFGSDETAAFGSTPTSFEIFVYTVDGYLYVGDGGDYFASSPSLVAGTFLAAISGKQQISEDYETVYDIEGVFSTPFRTAGLVNGDTTTGPTTTTTGPATTSGPGGGPGSGVVVGPEPSSMVLLGSVLVAVIAGLRKRLIRS